MKQSNLAEPRAILINGQRALFAWTVTDENLENPVSHSVMLEDGFKGFIFQRDFLNLDRESRETLEELVEWTMQELMAGRGVALKADDGDFDELEVILPD